jgi:hypothetical protein
VIGGAGHHVDEKIVRRKGGHFLHQDFRRPDALLREDGVRAFEDGDPVDGGAIV